MKSPPAVLVVDDDDEFRRVLVAELTRMHFHVAGVATADEAIRHVTEHEPEIVLLDLRLAGVSGLDVLRTIRDKSPTTDVIMLTGHGTIDTAIESIRMGAFDYLAKPCPLDELDVRIRRALERQSLRRRASLLERGLTPPDLGSAFIGESPEFRQVLHLIDRVAPTDSTVLISGETGTGKEMVAKLLHARSTRRSRPFVVVECAALQEALLQSELFGHERGAFTGAERAKAGLFEVAHGGTIFLDEIGEVSVGTQVKLLRVLDTSTFRHVGGTAEIHVDVRVIAATNRDLPAMVRLGLFREDLYYRLSTVLLTLPPLRDRRADIDLLAHHFAVRAERAVRREETNQRSGARRPAASRLAGQRPRAAARHRSRDGGVRRAGDPAGTPLRSPPHAAGGARGPRRDRRERWRHSTSSSVRTSSWRCKPRRATGVRRRECSESVNGICTGNCGSTGCWRDVSRPTRPRPDRRRISGSVPAGVTTRIQGYGKGARISAVGDQHLSRPRAWRKGAPAREADQIGRVALGRARVAA